MAKVRLVEEWTVTAEPEKYAPEDAPYRVSFLRLPTHVGVERPGAYRVTLELVEADDD